MGSFKLKQGLGVVFLPGLGRIVPGQVVTNDAAQRFVPQFLEEVAEEKKAEPIVAKAKELSVKAPPAVIHIPPVAAVPPPPPSAPEVKEVVSAAKSPEPEPAATMPKESRPTPPPPAKEKEKKAKKKG